MASFCASPKGKRRLDVCLSLVLALDKDLDATPRNRDTNAGYEATAISDRGTEERKKLVTCV